MGNHSKDVFVSDLKVKDNVEGLFLVKYIALMEGRDGRNYLNMVISDSSGDMECRLWGARTDEISEEIKKGQFVKIKGKVNQYQGRKQVVIQEVHTVPSEDVNADDFILKSSLPCENMYEELMKIVDGLDDVYIRDLLKGVLEDLEIRRRLLLWPAGKSIHHAYQSGLLEHILSCTNLAVYLSTHYRANKNYVVAGTILHDLGKIYELSDGLVVDYTEEGKLVGHMAKGLELVDRFSHRIKNFPYMMKMHLKHIILAHHGSYEYGSPKIPQTTEALLVHLIDYMDSKMNAVEMIKNSDTNAGHWSSFNKHLERIIFKAPLPYYPDYLPPRESNREEGPRPEEEGQEKENEREKEREGKEGKKEGPSRAKGHHPPRFTGPKEIKENLGKHLQGFKIDPK